MLQQLSELHILLGQLVLLTVIGNIGTEVSHSQRCPSHTFILLFALLEVQGTAGRLKMLKGSC